MEELIFRFIGQEKSTVRAAHDIAEVFREGGERPKNIQYLSK